ncbi:MAG: hypothetical protein ACPL6F_00630 [Anaerolineales bacterium]
MPAKDLTPIDFVILISADVEWRAVKERLEPAIVFRSPYGEWFDQIYDVKNASKVVRYFQGGWGKISAAGSTQYVIDQYRPGCILNLGTCGGIAGRIARGATVLVTETVIYDIIEQMGDFEQHIREYRTQLDLNLLKQPYPMQVVLAKMLSADKDLLIEDIPWLVQHFDALAADWESGAIAYIAKKNKVPILILRGVSDLVGEQGGEAYGNMNLFTHNATIIMGNLVDQLPKWLEAIQI